MKVEVWSDYACPFCYIGEKRLEKAVAQINGGDKIKIEFKSFELDPTASKDVVSSTVQRFAIKYGMTEEDAAARIEQISLMGSFDSLRLTKLAQEVRQDEMQASSYGIHGVPYFVINEKYALSGAQPVSVIRQALEEALSEEVVTNFDGMTCGGISLN